MEKKKTSLTFKIIKGLLYIFYPHYSCIGTAHIPDEPCIFVANHVQMHGPLACELHFPVDRYTWCAGEMMAAKEVPAYTYQDFWSEKPKGTRWFYKLLAYLITPLSVCIFNNANTIGVYHDSRTVSTFKKTVLTLQNGLGVVIFPEHDQIHNHIIYDFQDKFIDVAKLYYKRTGKAVSFVPVYIAPRLKKICFGAPTSFNTETAIGEERRRICDYLMDQITQIACDLPEHIVVPYKNLPKKQYGTNKVIDHEKTCC